MVSFRILKTTVFRELIHNNKLRAFYIPIQRLQMFDKKMQSTEFMPVQALSQQLLMF